MPSTTLEKTSVSQVDSDGNILSRMSLPQNDESAKPNSENGSGVKETSDDSIVIDVMNDSEEDTENEDKTNNDHDAAQNGIVIVDNPNFISNVSSATATTTIDMPSSNFDLSKDTSAHEVDNIKAEDMVKHSPLDESNSDKKHPEALSSTPPSTTSSTPDVTEDVKTPEDGGDPEDVNSEKSASIIDPVESSDDAEGSATIDSDEDRVVDDVVMIDTGASSPALEEPQQDTPPDSKRSAKMLSPVSTLPLVKKQKVSHTIPSENGSSSTDAFGANNSNEAPSYPDNTAQGTGENDTVGQGSNTLPNPVAAINQSISEANGAIAIEHVTGSHVASRPPPPSDSSGSFASSQTPSQQVSVAGNDSASQPSTVNVISEQASCKKTKLDQTVTGTSNDTSITPAPGSVAPMQSQLNSTVPDSLVQPSPMVHASSFAPNRVISQVTVENKMANTTNLAFPGGSVAPKQTFQAKGGNSGASKPPMVKSSVPLPPSKPSKPKIAAPQTPVNSTVTSSSKGQLCDPTFASYVKLDPVPNSSPLPQLSLRELSELERFLQFGDKNNPDNGWREDWSGNLQLIDKDLVMNRHVMALQPHVKPVMKPFHEWVAENTISPEGFRGVRLLFSHVYHMKGTPNMAKKILSHALSRPAKTVEQRLRFIIDGVRRISYDPTVLRQDGWTTVKASCPDGASGGAFLIGRKVLWSRYEAIIIAFVHDDEIGDLWKAMWVEDLETFDLEADELQEARKKWEAKESRKKKISASTNTKLLSGAPVGKPVAPSGASRSTSARYASFTDFNVSGIGHGIVLAMSFHQNARHGVLWPARVMHVSEMKQLPSNQQSRRSAAQKNVSVVFLAPYWNGRGYSKSKGGANNHNGDATDPKSIYCTGELFQFETVEATDATIQKYPYENTETLSIDKVRSEFRFIGLPKAAFYRFLDSHRLAMALKAYAKDHIPDNGCPDVGAMSALTECHTLSVKTAIFPRALLNLPYDFVLSKLPPPSEQASLLMGEDGEDISEPVIDLNNILTAMTPPQCFRKGREDGIDSPHAKHGDSTLSLLATPQSKQWTQIQSPSLKLAPSSSCGSNSSGSGEIPLTIESVASEYLLRALGNGNDEGKKNSPSVSCLGFQLSALVSQLSNESPTGKSANERKKRLNLIVNLCMATKSFGEGVIHTGETPEGFSSKSLISEWRKTCERIYKRAIAKYSSPGYGQGVTTVITDSRCNQHLTAAGSFERAVRLPAAIRGAKQAGAGTSINLPLITKVKESYLTLAKEKILPKAHKASYLKRMKSKIAALPPDARGVPLTDDSDGEGGEDTQGSRGSYTAAVAGVAAALQGVDMIIGGECVNAFCAIRPPGHHAGRELRAMNAVSNGFCVLNSAACAALFAATPQSEGGRGLKRVCVIDFDVHHGNGTQDILCSTYDSRFLYVSLHAGGSHVNGFEESAGDESDNDIGFRRSLPGSRQEGIYPGRCGDTSPHPGVLNLPLGPKVTAHAIGTALVTKVAPAVETFSPELIILSAGFDAHKHDPLGMGGLSSEDFGSVTDVACQMAVKSCSGRVLSLLEGGYGVPCCRPRQDLFLPSGTKSNSTLDNQWKYLNLAEDMPDGMEDEVPFLLQQKLDKCHGEGFLDCVKEHISALARSNKRRG